MGGMDLLNGNKTDPVWWVVFKLRGGGYYYFICILFYDAGEGVLKTIYKENERNVANKFLQKMKLLDKNLCVKQYA